MVALTRRATCAFRDASVDYTVTHLLLGVIVGRLDAACEHETEVVLRHVVAAAIGKLYDEKTLGHVRRFLGIGRFSDDFQKTITMRDHRTWKTDLRHVGATMPS